MYVGVHRCVCEWLWMHVYLWVCVNVNACVLGMEPGWCGSLYVYLWIYGCLCLFVTVIVHTFVYCQLVNMEIVCFGGSIKRERGWGSLVGSIYSRGGIWEIKAKASRGAPRHPPTTNPYPSQPRGDRKYRVCRFLILFYSPYFRYTERGSRERVGARISSQVHQMQGLEVLEAP